MQEAASAAKLSNIGRWMPRKIGNDSLMKPKPDFEKIQTQLQAIRPKKFYRLIAIIFLLFSGLFFTKALSDENTILFVAVGGIFLIVAVAIWAIGQMAHTYKAIIESLLNEIEKDAADG